MFFLFITEYLYTALFMVMQTLGKSHKFSTSKNINIDRI